MRLLPAACVAFVGCTGSIEPPQPKAPPPPPEGPCVPAGEVQPSSMLRITRVQADNLVHDLFGAAFVPSSVLPNDEKLGPFAANAVTSASRGLVEQYQFVAEQVAIEVQADVQRFAPCAQPTTDGAACAERFVRELGRRVFRRPLDADAETRWLALYTAEAAAADYPAGIGAVVEGMLQSPHFIYRLELLPPGTDPASTETFTVDGPALAARLSFLLWNSGPDDALLDDAERLHEPAVLEAQAARLLADPRGKNASAAFAEAWAGIEPLQAAASSPGRLGPIDPALLPLMRDETVAVVDRLRAEGATTAVLFAETHSVQSSALAAHYGASGLELPKGQRFGVLGHASVLFSHAHSEQTSPVLRGRWLRQNVFCQMVPDPPPEVVAVPPAPQPGQTTRERFEQHRTEPSCAACHKLLDPVGFGLEAFNQYGRHRDTDSGKPVDDTGTLTGTDVDGDFKGPGELAAKLAQSDTARQCFSKQWFRFGLGHAESPRDACTVKAMSKAGAQEGFHGLLRELITSPAFSERRSP